MTALPLPESFEDYLQSIVRLLTRIDGATASSAALLQDLDRRLSQLESQGDPEFLSIKDAAAVTRLSATTIRRAIKASRLPASDIGTPAHPHYRIARSDLLSWLEKNRGGGQAPPRPQRVRRKVKSRYFDEM